MLTGGKKFQKPVKTKFKKNRDRENQNQNLFKSKHHDKSAYRLLKQEKEEYVV